jgi:hypothetical protein
MPTDDVDEDVQNLGEQIHELLIEMQLPKFSERLSAQTYTASGLLSMIGNAALFAEDCSKVEFKGEYAQISPLNFEIFECNRVWNRRE